MIAADFPYLRADTAEEAVEAWSRHKSARYLAGGTEITTSARRTSTLPVGALVDIKRIPEVNIHEMQAEALVLGAALTLTDVVEGDAFPFLSAVLRGIADHSVRNRLTLGGNVAGMLPYREAVLPLLLCETSVQTILPGKEGTPATRRNQKLRDIFDKRLILAPGELLLSFSVPIEATELVWSHHRKTRTGPVDYPLVTSCLLRDEEAIRLAISGAHPYPVRSDEVDAALTKGGAAAVEEAIDLLGAFRTDSRGSADYRTALLGNMIRASLEEVS
jgi:CO/xanthine dehydrogenase FAD-binding subunit